MRPSSGCKSECGDRAFPGGNGEEYGGSDRQRRIEAERGSSSGEERPSPDEASPDADEGAQNQPDTPPPTNEEGNDYSKPKALTEDEVKAQQEKLAADQAKEYLTKMKESLCKTCLDIIERSSMPGDGVE